MASMYNDQHWMRQALNLSVKGLGCVEPNPMVGCVLVQDDQCIGYGYHAKFGQGHAEVQALANAAEQGNCVVGATAYVTLEPCCHHGKTPPCTNALMTAGIQRVVIGVSDPFPKVAGGGIGQLQQAGIAVEVGVLEAETRQVLAAYLKRQQTGLPWVIAKWAMTLDGRIASSSGDSQWISGEGARRLVHEVRGRVDAIVVGIGTALADDPSLTARPAGPRTALRVVVDRKLRLPIDAKLVQTAMESPVILAAGADADPEKLKRLKLAGVEVWQPAAISSAESKGFSYSDFVRQFMAALSERGVTNVLVEGGGQLLGNLFDQDCVDEAMVFVSPKVIGGQDAIASVAGEGRGLMSQCHKFKSVSHQVLGDDVLIHCYLDRAGN